MRKEFFTLITHKHYVSERLKARGAETKKLFLLRFPSDTVQRDASFNTLITRDHSPKEEIETKGILEKH